jgi:hypothetical protein
MFLKSALDGVSGQRHAPAALYPRERTPVTHWIGGWVGLRPGLDTDAREKILCFCWESNSGRSVCIQTLLTELPGSLRNTDVYTKLLRTCSVSGPGNVAGAFKHLLRYPCLFTPTSLHLCPSGARVASNWHRLKYRLAPFTGNTISSIATLTA